MIYRQGGFVADGLCQSKHRNGNVRICDRIVRLTRRNVTRINGNAFLLFL